MRCIIVARRKLSAAAWGDGVLGPGELRAGTTTRLAGLEVRVGSVALDEIELQGDRGWLPDDLLERRFGRAADVHANRERAGRTEGEERAPFEPAARRSSLPFGFQ